MVEHRFYCGLSEQQLLNYTVAGQCLFVDPDRANVALYVDDIRTRYRHDLPAYLIDLLELAAYVFAADNLTSRGGAKREKMASAWRRNFCLIVAVREPGLWSRPEVVEALVKALNFISDDNWTLGFVPAVKPANADAYFNLRPAEDDGTASSNIVLFSGGLDSLSGAVRELSEGRQSVVLVSHRAAKIVSNRQDKLISALKKQFGDRAFHVPVRIHMKGALSTREFTQRTRSFLFTAIATAVAELDRSTNIRFYENGVMSINLPPAAHYVGTRASRTTHPHAIYLLQDALRRVCQSRLEINNPYIWMTKSEVVKELVRYGHAELIKDSISCTSIREATAMHPHCGCCVQCMQRRLSVIFAGAEECDPREFYATDLLEGSRPDAVERAMSVDLFRHALEISRSSDLEFLSAHGGQISNLSAAFPGLTPDKVAQRVIELFQRYANEVYSVLSSGTSVLEKDEAGKGAVADSLSSLAGHVDVDEIDPRMFDRRIAERSKVSAISEEIPDVGSDGLVLIIDQGRSEIEVDGLDIEEKGQTIFAIAVRLAEQRQRDVAKNLHPRDYRPTSLRTIADELKMATDGPLRSAISRFHKKIEREHFALYPDLPVPKDIFENVRGQGYRISPFVVVHWRPNRL